MEKGPLRAVVTEGGGDKAEGQRYTVLGKTGTAKLVAKERGHYEEGAYLGTFIGAAPASDPKIVAMVMIRRPNPAKAYYGGSVAAPAVAEIFDRSLSYLGVPPDKKDEKTAVVTSYAD
jgi:cell division protein FtsI/penicillin-binding protein 2